MLSKIFKRKALAGAGGEFSESDDLRQFKRAKRKETTFIIALILPYAAGFFVFIVLPVIIAVVLSFTSFDTINFPSFVGLTNYIRLFTEDEVFMQRVLPNTIIFALVAGPVGYILAFTLAWMLAQVTKRPRTILALMIYAPTLAAGVTVQVVWQALFSGDESGYINALMLSWGFISEPVQWLQSPQYLMPIMIIVTVWSSMGVGFLAMLSGILNVDPELYEAAYIDGLKNRFQEIWRITIPSMKPQLLFGAVMAVVATFQAGAIGVMLSGANPTPDNAGQLILNHIEDYGFIRFEMGYAAAISVVLLVMIYCVSKVIRVLLTEKN